MSTNLPRLVRRVATIVNQYREWFETVARWYEDAKAAKEFMLKLWVAGVEPTCRVRMSVNGKFLDDGAQDRRSSRHHLFWIVPPSCLHTGDNDLILWVDRDKGPPMSFGGVAVEHSATLPDEVRQDSRPTPASTTQVSVTFRVGEGFRLDHDRWTTQIHHDTLKFHLHLAERVPMDFTLGVAALLPGAGHEINLDALWEKIDELVKDKIKELAQEETKLEAEGRTRSSGVEKNLEDLQDYQKLHHVHLAEAIKAGDGESLQDVIHRTEEPEELLKPRRKKLPRPPMSLVARMFILILIVGGAILIAWRSGWIDKETIGWIEAKVGGKKEAPPPAVRPPQNETEVKLTKVLQDNKAKTGDVQVSLAWHNKNDLDLHVVCPSGERLYYGNKRSKCGGELDLDMNARGYQNAAANAAENVYWPTGKAPRGHYKVIVNHYGNQGKPDCQDPTPFSVLVKVRGADRWFHGEVERNNPARREKVVHEFDLN